MNWTWSRFAELSVDDLYDALALRGQVFIVEQVAYLDPDGVDRHSWHLLGRDDDGVLQAYLRVVDPGVNYPEPSLGRVAVRAERRRGGLGRRLLAEGLSRCESIWPGRANRIGAQLYLERFYESFGYRRLGEPYLEDGIAHIEMLRSR